MSNSLAIATVSATLQQLLLSGIRTDFPNALVTIGEPITPQVAPSPQVNICMYQISPNMGYRNYDLPAKDSKGNWVNTPKLGLDLLYLLTFYGNHQQLEPERLLGDVILTLYTQPVLTKSMIQAAISNPLYPFLSNSNLADETVEQVKLIPQANPKEEIAKLWADYFQTIPYALSLAYQASVVLLDGDQIPQAADPVTSIIVDVFPVNGAAAESESGINLPPRHKAKAITLNLTEVRDAHQILGNITITNAVIEKDITQYRLYWGTAANQKLANSKPFAILPKSSNLVFTIDTPLTVPDHVKFILVYTSNFLGEMAEGISAELPPLDAPAGLTLALEKRTGSEVGGKITIRRALDQSHITKYRLYWGTSPTAKLSAAAILTREAEETDLICYLSPPILRPEQATYVLAYSVNDGGEMSYGAFAGIPPLNKAAFVEVEFTKNAKQLSGNIRITRALDESDITGYSIYWGSSPDTKLTDSPITVLPKASSLDQPLNNETWPEGATHVLVFTENEQAEMADGINTPIPPLDTAKEVRVDNFTASSGDIHVSKSQYEDTITEYLLYWSSNGTTPLADTNAFTTFPATGEDLPLYTFSAADLPDNASYVLVLTRNNNVSAPMTHGVSAALPPFNKAVKVELALIKAAANSVTGSITVTKAPDEGNISQYLLYWGTNPVTKLNNTAFATKNKNNNNLVFDLSPPISRPTEAAYVLAITKSLSGIEIAPWGWASAAIAPLNTAASVTANLTRLSDNNISGKIKVTRAFDESDITYYNLYWGTDSNHKLTFIDKIAQTDSDDTTDPGKVSLTLSTPTSLSSEAKYVLVFTENDLGIEMDYGIYTAIAPIDAAEEVTITLTKNSNNQILGNINITKAPNEDTVTEYSIYWSADGNIPLPSVNVFTSLPATGSNLPPCQFSANNVPDAANYVLVLTRNNNTSAPMASGVHAAIPPLSEAVAIAPELIKNARQVSGTIRITKAVDERHITGYSIYWGSSASAKLTSIAVLPKAAVLEQPLDNETWPQGATHILVFSKNELVEMTFGVNTPIPPLDAAQAISLDNITTDSGDIHVSKAQYEDTITEYLFYWSSDGTTPLPSATAFNTSPVTGNNLPSYTFASTDLPDNAAYVLVLTRNNNVSTAMAHGVSALLPPFNKAVNVSAVLTKNSNGQVSGNIDITKAIKENTITDYLLYWSADGKTPLAGSDAFARIDATGNPLPSYPVSAITFPNGTMYILVLTANASYIMESGVSTCLAPVNKAQKIELHLLKAAGNAVGGDITVTKAANEDDLKRYNLYWGSTQTTKLTENSKFASLEKNSGLVYLLSPPIARPTDSRYVLGFTENDITEMANGIFAGIPPLNKAAGMEPDLRRDMPNLLSGKIIIRKAFDESDITKYCLHWGIDANTPLGAAFITKAAINNDIEVQISSLEIRETATHILLFTGNDQAEMTYGLSSQIP